jgi:putative colanic acid biosynthesis UDP-glucose lipid carrier transferase
MLFFQKLFFLDDSSKTFLDANALQPVNEPQVRLHENAVRVCASVPKRLLDITGALFGLVFLAPFFLVIAALIRLESPGSVIFKQRRTGLGGKVFHIYKFRTMRVTEDGSAVVQAKKGDSRITPLGRHLRRYSIDELPQLWNVLIGDMSLIGPRPHALTHDAYYGTVITKYNQRFLVRPGIAGLAQVKGLRGPTESIMDMAHRVDQDLAYIESWSFPMDVWLLIVAVFYTPFHEKAI